MTAAPTALRLEPFTAVDDAWATWPRGDRPGALRAAAAGLRARLREDPPVEAVRTVDLATVTVPGPAALAGVARPVSGAAHAVHRLVVVAFEDLDGERRLLAWEPRAVDETLQTDWTPAEVASQRARWKAEIDAERPGIVPVCDALSAALPKNTMIFSDMTQFAYAALEIWDLAQPGLWHHPTGFGTLGYGLPAAIGGALGHDGPVLAIAGDYGIQYTIQELGTAAELGLSLPILVWDNNALGEIRDNMVSAQISPVAVTLKNPEWRHLAAAYACGYAEPATLADLCQTVNAAFTAGRPTIIRATPGLAA